MTGISAKTRRLVHERDRFTCRRCGVYGNNIHHRIGRGMGGTKREDVNSLAALVTLCGSGTTGCHGWITEHPEEAYRLGWSIRRSEPDPAESIPLVDKYGQFFWLTEDGGVIYAETTQKETTNL